MTHIFPPADTANTLEIPAYRLATLAEKIARINKRAVRAGATPFAMTVHPEAIQRRLRTESGKPITVTFRTVTLTGPEFKIAGFHFLARIDHVTSGTAGLNLVCAAPDAPAGSIPEKFRTAAPHCDHCGVNRERNDTFILRHGESGEVRQIGRNCLADYIGHNAESMLALFTGYGRILDDMREESYSWAGAGAFQYGADALDILAYTAAAMTAFGWVSKGNSDPDNGRYATASIVTANLLNPEGAAKNGDAVDPTDSDYDQAAAALAWLRNVLPNKARRSDYEHNLIATYSQDWISTKAFGFACAAMFSYSREVERQVERRADQSKRGPSQHIGTLGGRLDLTGIAILGTYEMPSDFGVTTIVRMRDESGNNLVWFASRNPNVAAGDVVNLRATVKRHGQSRRDGTAETVLTRCVVSDKRRPPA